MKFWPIFLFILVSCNDGGDSIDKGKCLSCHFFLGKKADDNYVVLRENLKTQKMEVVVDSIDAINSQNCNIFFQRKKEYILLRLSGDKFITTSFQTEGELLEYCHKNQITTGDLLNPASSIFENSPDRMACE